MYYLYTITPDGKTTKTESESVPQYETISEAVGGYIETVPHFDKYEGRPCVAFCNEEGKLDGLDPNPVAQQYWDEQLGFYNPDYLVGPILIIAADTKQELWEL